MHPSEFNDESKFLAGFLGLLITIGVVSYHGCSQAMTENMTNMALGTRQIDIKSQTDIAIQRARADVQIACLKADHPALECKELR